MKTHATNVVFHKDPGQQGTPPNLPNARAAIAICKAAINICSVSALQIPIAERACKRLVFTTSFIFPQIFDNPLPGVQKWWS